MEKETSIHHKLFKFFMMPILMMLVSVGQVWGQETVSVAAGKLKLSSSKTSDGDKSEVLTNFSSSNVKDNVYSLGESCNVTTGKRNSENLKVPITITPKNDYTITKVVLKWRVGNYTPSDVSNLSCENVSSYTTTEFIPADGTEDIVIDKSNSGKSDYQVSAITIFYYKDATDETKPTFTWVTPKVGESSITLIASEPITLVDNEIPLDEVGCLNYDGEDYHPSARPVIGDDGKTVTITFREPFTEGTNYDFTLNAGVFTDDAGNKNDKFTEEEFTPAEKPLPTLTASDIEVTVGSSVVPNVQYNGDGTATYSGHESIATFADGMFTGTKAGTATVTVNYSETENYKAATAEFTLTVKEKPSTTGLYTVKFNNKTTVQSPKVYFTFEGKHNYSEKVNCSYNGEAYKSGLKMEGSTTVKFENTKTCTVTIIQSTNESCTIEFDGTEYEAKKVDDHYEYVIENVQPGKQHTITQGDEQAIVLFISVSEIPSVDETAPVLSLQSNKIKAGSNLVVKANEAVTLAEGVESVSAIINGTAVTGTLNTEDNTITFSTDGLSLNKGAEYSIVVAANQVQDANGNKNIETTLTFNTKVAANITVDGLTLNVGETKATTVSVAEGKATYSGYEDIATFADSKFTGIKAGSATVTVTVSETDNYEAGSATFTLTVSKGAVTLSATEIAVQEGSTANASVVAKDASGKAVEGLTYTYSSADEAVATVSADGKITGNKIGSTTINVAFAGNDNYNSTSVEITVTVTKKDAGVANHWDFTSWDSEDIKTIIADEKWEDSNSDENVVTPPYTYVSELDGASFDFKNTEGLLFTASSNRLTINAVTDGNGYIRLHNESATIALPAQIDGKNTLTEGQIITLTTQSTNSSARGLVPTDACKAYVELVSPSATGSGTFQSQYRVTAEGAGKSIVFHSSDNGIYVKKIEVSLSLNDPGLKFVDSEGNTVTEITANISNSESFVEPELTMSPNAQGLSITYRSSNPAVATVDAQTGNVTFTSAATAGGSVVIYATSAATEAFNETTTSYTINFKVTTSIKFVDTDGTDDGHLNVTGYLNVGFVEPQPVLTPAGLNVVKYTSSNPEVATVIENTGEVTFIKAGTVTITASVAEDEYYTASSDSYTITVQENADIATGATAANYKIENLDAVNGNIGNKFYFTGEGMIAGGLNITYMPGTEMTFGRYEADHAADWTVDSNKEIALKKDGKNAPVEGITEDNLLPTGGGYFALEPVVSGMLALNMTYFKDEQVVIVDKATKNIVEAYTYTSKEDDAAATLTENHEFSVPLQGGHTYYIYNRGVRSDNGKYESTASSNGLQMKAISYTPVFVGAVSHAVPANNTFKFAGKAYYEGTATVPSLATASHKNDEITYSTTNSLLTMSEETGEFVISDEVVNETGVVTATITATMTTTSTHGGTPHEHTATATCTVEYNRTELKFSAGSVALYITEGFTADQITEPTLNFINKEGAEIYSTGGNFKIDAVTGDVTEITNRANDVVTATLTGDLLKYYTSTASYELNVMADLAPIKINEAEIELIVGTGGYNLLENKIIEVTNDEIYIEKVENDKTVKKIWKDLTDFQEKAQTFFNDPSTNISSEPGKENGSQSTNVVSINKRLGLDAKTVGTAIVYLNMKKTKDGSGTYEATPIKITVHVLPRPFDETKATLRVWDFTKGVDASKLNDGYWTTTNAETGETTTEGMLDAKAEKYFTKKDYGLTANPLYLTSWRSGNENEGAGLTTNITVNTTTTIGEVPGMTPVAGMGTNLGSEYNGKLYKGIKLYGHASYIGIDGIEDGMNVTMTIDNYGSGTSQLVGSSNSVMLIFPKDYNDPQDATNDYKLNRLTNVCIYRPDGDGSMTFEQNDGVITVTNIVAGYPAATGLLNKGNGAKPSSDRETVTRTAGYATLISPYNIDMTGQKAVKAYICTYYGYANNQVHMKQIRHIPANTPVMLKGYARDMYVLYISEGNKPVDHGIDQSVFEQNRLVGVLTPTMVNTTEEVVGTDGIKVTYYNFGLNGHQWTKYTRSGVLGEGRAYLRLTEDEYADLKAASVSGSSSASRTTIIFEDLDDEEDDNTTTGIENIAR
ncbi:MAG: Ig-like domain-containing protein, partial [Prevotella sp.]|nr:Ig-like domain-containing protein [Prevotella sp.]